MEGYGVGFLSSALVLHSGTHPSFFCFSLTFLEKVSKNLRLLLPLENYASKLPQAPRLFAATNRAGAPVPKSGGTFPQGHRDSSARFLCLQKPCAGLLQNDVYSKPKSFFHHVRPAFGKVLL